MANFKRAPRNPKYWPAYFGHAVQGFVCGAIVPPPISFVLLVIGYWLYQVVEYRRFADRRDAEQWAWEKEHAYIEAMGKPIDMREWVVDDWPSRDIADHMIGMWVGAVVGLPTWMLIALRLVL